MMKRFFFYIILFIVSGVVGIISEIIKGRAPYNLELASFMFVQGSAIFFVSLLITSIYCLYYRAKHKTKCKDFRERFLSAIIILSVLYLGSLLIN